jgi:DNA-binding NarL/FixJ family response regulator
LEAIKGENMGEKIRVLVADDVMILRKGLEAVLKQAGDMEVVGSAADGKQALLQARAARPHVVLMDMRMPEYDGAWATGQIKNEFPEMKVLVLTTFDDEETIDKALESGADGYVLKEMEDEKILAAIRSVHSGISVFGDRVYASMRKRMTKPAKPAKIPDFSGREREILRLVAAGMDNREIAAGLFLAEGTVRNQISRLLEKLELKDRTQLAVYAVKHQLDE